MGIRHLRIDTKEEPVNAPEVKVGQVWADNDKRSRGRHVLVVALLPAMPSTDPHVRDTPARAEVVPCAPTGRIIRNGRGQATNTKIRLSRFRPSSTGYRLVRDVDER